MKQPRLRRSSSPQVIGAPDLALGAGGRLVDACIGLAVPGRPIRPLVAEDRSAEGVRDRTGPENPRSVLGPYRTGTPGARAVASGHQGTIRIAGGWLSSSSSRHEASGQIRLWSRRSRVQVPSVTPLQIRTSQAISCLTAGQLDQLLQRLGLRAARACASAAPRTPGLGRCYDLVETRHGVHGRGGWLARVLVGWRLYYPRSQPRRTRR
jgi:hypothetical protein